MKNPTVFICFASEDEPLAKRLYQDLTAAGADVFNFLECVDPADADNWSQVVDYLTRADFLLAVVTQHLRRSVAAIRELTHSFGLLASPRKRPEIFPLIVDGAKKPEFLVGLSDVPFDDYDTGARRLRALLSLGGNAPLSSVPEIEAAPPAGLEWIEDGSRPKHLSWRSLLPRLPRHWSKATARRARARRALMEGAEGWNRARATEEIPPDLGGEDLTKTVLRGYNLQDVKLRKVDLRGVDLRGASLERADMRHARLDDANLSGVSLRGATLDYASARGAQLDRADLRHASLLYADLGGSDFRHADFTGAKIYEDRWDTGSSPQALPNLRGANLACARFDRRHAPPHVLKEVVGQRAVDAGVLDGIVYADAHLA